MTGWIASAHRPSSPRREPLRPVPTDSTRRKRKRRALFLSEAAVDDIAGIYRWYTQPGAGAAAARRVRAIRSAIRGLIEYPCRFRRGQHPGSRELITQNHVVVYELHPDTGDDSTAGDVFIVRVFGPGQSRDQL